MGSIDAALVRNSIRLSKRAGKQAHGVGWLDSPPLTTGSVEGELPKGRELSLAWLTGTVMTGLVSVLLMGAALYVSFRDLDSYSTASQALLVQKDKPEGALTGAKRDRMRPRAETRSDLELVEASVKMESNGRTIIRNEQFTRLAATLAISRSPLAEDIPDFDPSAVFDEIRSQTNSAPEAEFYSSRVEGEVAVTLLPVSAALVPAAFVSDAQAAEYVGSTLQTLFEPDDQEVATLSYVRSVGLATEATAGGDSASGLDAVTVLPKTSLSGEGGGRSEKIVTLHEPSSLREPLLRNGFTEQSYQMIAATLKNILPALALPAESKLRILMGPSRSSPIPIPYRLSLYVRDREGRQLQHAATAALSDGGRYVIGLPPGEIEFPEEDIEDVDVSGLPTLYRSIWETNRKHNIDDAATARVIALFAYEVDLTQKVSPGDSLELLMTRSEKGKAQLLYASLDTGSARRELFRFRAKDGSVEYYGPDGSTGKRFLIRRPLHGNGRLSSRYGYRTHPITKARRLHSGVDLASSRGTPVYAGGDGTVKRAQWVSGYGRFVEIDHVNGYQTRYAHMSRIAEGLKPGMPVSQGQIVGYVGSTGNSTGNHLHYEIRINGRSVDPLSVKLPRDKELQAASDAAFSEKIAELRRLMARDGERALPE